jgi:hypothetical protein
MSRMRRALPISLLVIALTSTADSQATGDARQAISCASLAGLKLDNTTITGAIPVPAGSRDVSHCRVLGRIDKEITFTALLPDRWNGSFFGGGAGGFAGTSENQAQASLNLGFATAGSDPPSCRFGLATLPACTDDRPAVSCVTSAQRAGGRCVRILNAPSTTARATSTRPAATDAGDCLMAGS